MDLYRSTRGRTRIAVTTAALAALVGGAVVAPAYAADPEMFCDVPGQELAISPISDLQDGEAVTWLSTVKGTTPTEFTGEYVGKLDNGLGYDASGQPRDLLLVKLSGPIVDGAPGTHAAGVWSGASGSPVYDADGALIGAVSYGFTSAVDNVAGVTPAAYMKSIGDLPLTKSLSRAAQKEIAKMTGEAPPAASATASIRQLQPVRVTTGTTAAKLDAINARLARTVDGYRPVTSGGLAIDGGASDGADYPIVTGGNIAVSFGYGAVASASVGTVTAVCGDEVFAFGHPNQWDSSLTANIHGASAARIVPGSDSYKLVSAVGKVKGTLVDDRLAGIKGTLGAGTPTITITTVSDAGDQRSRAVSHISEPLVLASAAAAQVSTDATRMLDNQWKGTAKISWSILYQREDGTQATLANTNRYSSAEGLPDLITWDLGEDIAQLQSNPFEEVKILRVKVAARYIEGYRAARLSGVQLLQKGAWKNVKAGSVNKVTRGKTYSFRTVLSPVPGSVRVTEYRPFTVTIPQSLKKTMAVVLSVPVPNDYFEDDSDTFEEFVAALDSLQRSDVVTRTRSYVSTGGKKYVSKAQMVTPTVVEPGRISFTLDAGAKK